MWLFGGAPQANAGWTTFLVRSRRGADCWAKHGNEPSVSCLGTMDAFTGMYWEPEPRPELWQVIGEAMRRYYAPILREPVPKAMQELLREIEAAGK
jgi:hypothetical protein